MVGVDREPGLLERRRRERREELIADLEHRSAFLADEMAVRRRGEVVGRGAVAEMHMGDDAEPLELLEVAVNGRDVKSGATVWISAVRSSAVQWHGDPKSKRNNSRLAVVARPPVARSRSSTLATDSSSAASPLVPRPDAGSGAWGAKDRWPGTGSSVRFRSGGSMT